MPKMPAKEQLDIAISWLRCNEGEGKEAAACEAVAAWIDDMEAERYIKSAARKAGVTVSRFKSRLVERGIL